MNLKFTYSSFNKNVLKVYFGSALWEMLQIQRQLRHNLPLWEEGIHFDTGKDGLEMLKKKNQKDW